MKWQKPTIENLPPFKKTVLGLQLPDKIMLVQLEKIDETGLVFIIAYDQSSLTSTQGSFTRIFNSAMNIPITIDLWAEIELPLIDETDQTKDKPIFS